MSTWWKNASTEDRLKQIDAGISLGMTARQVAMNLRVQMYPGSRESAVSRFANNHGRYFNGRSAKSPAKAAAGKAGGLVSARRRGVMNLSISSAFSIFGDDQPERLASDALNFEGA